MPHSTTTVHSERIINKRIGPVPHSSPLPLPLPSSICQRSCIHEETQDGKKTAGKAKGCKHQGHAQARRDGVNIGDVTSEMERQAKGKGESLRVK